MESRQLVDVHVVHATPGRVRLKVSREALASTVLSQISHALRELSGIREVRINPLARSVVVTYDENMVDVAALLVLATALGLNVVLPSEMAPEMTESRPIAQSITAFFREADHRVADLTGGNVDLRTVVPLGLAVLGVRELLVGRAAALPWYVCFWYAYNTFTDLQRRPTSPMRPPSTSP